MRLVNCETLGFKLQYHENVARANLTKQRCRILVDLLSKIYFEKQINKRKADCTAGVIFSLISLKSKKSWDYIFFDFPDFSFIP